MRPGRAAMTIAPVGDGNRMAAIELMTRFFREEGFDTPPRVIAQNLSAMIRDPSCWVAIACDGGRAAGIVTVSIIVTVEQGKYAEIGDLYVLPEYRGRQLARLMIDAATVWSRAQGCSGVFVTVTPAGESRHGLSQFYQRLRFKPTGCTMMTLDFAGA